MATDLPVSGNRRSRGRSPGICGAFVAVALAGCWRCGPPSPPAARSLVASLVEAAPGRRPGEPRLTGSWAWRPCSHAAPEPVSDDDLIPDVVCEEPLSEPERRALADVAVRIRRASRGAPSAAALHASGLFHLLTGSGPAAADSAIDALKGAVRLNPDSAEIRSDLAAAWLIRAVRRDDPQDLFAAFAASEAALSLDPASLAALFNRNLVLERLALEAAAAAGWRDYLARDPDSPWRAEAAERLAVLERPSLRALWEAEARRLGGARAVGPDPRFLQQTRLHIEDVLLPAWASLQLAGGEREAAQRLATVRGLAEPLAAATGDELLEGAIAVLDRAADPALRSLAEGHLAYGRARSLHDAQRYDDARSLFLRTADRWERAGSPFALWASFYLAVEDYHRGDYRTALDALYDLRDRADASFPVFRAYVFWMLGLVHHVNGYPQIAEKHYLRARRIFDAAGEVENRVAMENHLARTLDRMGRSEDAWRYRYRTLRGLPRVVRFRRLNNVLSLHLESHLAEGRPALAALYQADLLRWSRASGNPVLIALALRRSGMVEEQLDHPDEAARLFEEAFEASREIPALGDRQVVRMDLLRSRAALDRDGRPERAIELLEEARERFTDRAYRVRWIEIDRELARLHIAAGHFEEAEEAFTRALNEARDQVRGLEPAHWPEFLRITKPLFQDLIAFQVEHRGDVERAFFLSEEARSWDLRAMIGSQTRGAPASALTAEEPPSLAELQAALAADVGFVVFESLSDQLLIWWVTAAGLELVREPWPQKELETEVNRLVDSMLRGESSPRPPRRLTRLTEELRRRIPAGSRLVAVPSGPLHRAPLGAIRDPETGRRMAEDYALVLAPGVAAFLRSTERARRRVRPSSEASLLAVGNPAFDRHLAPHLGDLPHAEIEVAEIAALFPQASLLVGHDATKARFLQQLRQTRPSIVHFGGHTVVSLSRPEASKLLLAPSEDDRGELELGELFGIPMPETRLVVLASCDSALGTAGDGAVSLAIPFLHAGVPFVVASLWPVEDQVAEELMKRFYRELLAGRDIATALRDAQVSLMESGELRAAGFVLLGGTDS